MPFPNEHACRIVAPRSGAKTRRVNGDRSHDGRSYDVIYQQGSDGKWQQQAFRYPKKGWTAKQARAHCRAHDGLGFEAAGSSQNSFVLTTSQATPSTRVEQFQGRDFLVAPAVLVQGQVLHNNLGATFLPAAEITNEWADEWNGIPVIVHDHPSSRGVATSARTPEIMDGRGVGYVFRARVVRNGMAQLKAEVWLDLARAQQITELRQITDRLRAGETVELSTGFNALAKDEPGVHNGEPYERVLYPQGADHLAIFLDKTGACSLEDGCGLGVQRRVIPTQQEETVVEERLSAPCSERGRLIRLFERILGIGTAGDKEETITEDASQNVEGTGTEFRILLRRLKALGMTNAEIGDALDRSASAIGQVERGEIINPSPQCLERLRALSQTRMSMMSENERSDEEYRLLLALTLESRFGGDGKGVWIEAVYSEEKRVVFGMVSEDLTGRTEQLYAATFEAADNGEITLSEPEVVTRKVIYEPVGNITEEEEETHMKTPEELTAETRSAEEQQEKAQEVAANTTAEETPISTPKVELEGSVEEVENEAPEKAPGEEAAPASDAEEKVETVLPDAIVELQNTVAAQAAEIAKLREQIAPAVEDHEKERQALVDSLATNELVPFDKDELEAKPLEELKKLDAMSRRESYVGRGGPKIPATNVKKDEPQYAEPVAYWPASTTEGDEKEANK